MISGCVVHGEQFIKFENLTLMVISANRDVGNRVIQRTKARLKERHRRSCLKSFVGTPVHYRYVFQNSDKKANPEMVSTKAPLRLWAKVVTLS